MLQESEVERVGDIVSCPILGVDDTIQLSEVERFGDTVRCLSLGMYDTIQQDLDKGAHIGFVCEATKENLLEWLRMYKKMTSTNLTIYTCVGPSSGRPFLVCRAHVRCPHNVPDRPSAPRKRPSVKDTGCSWRLVLTAKKTSGLNIKTKNPLYGCGLVVRATGTHNHPTTSPAALSRQRPGGDASQAQELVRRVSDALLKDVTASLIERPDQGPAWQKSLSAFLRDWSSGSTSARQAQLCAQRSPSSGMNGSTILVLRQEQLASRPPRGRRRTAAGRPSKESGREHPYHREQGGRPQPAPHDLQTCVGTNAGSHDVLDSWFVHSP